MTSSEFEEIKQKLYKDYSKARFQVITRTNFPDLNDLAHDQAIHLKNVVFGFVDIRNFTKWSSSTDEDTAFRLVKTTLKTFTRVIRMHHGAIEKQTGDGLMFIIGSAEEDPKDVAQTAAECALDLIRVGDKIVAPFMHEKQHRLDLMDFGIGMAMGDALIAKVGIRGHYMLTSISKAANRAAKIESQAGNDEIMIDQTIKNHLGGTVYFKKIEKRGEISSGDYFILNL